MAGYIPGAILAISLMVGSYIISIKRHYPKGEPFSMKTFIKQLLESFWALAAILIVVVGVVGGVFTATESAAIAVVYSLLVSLFIYKGLTLKGVWKALDTCVETLAIVLILIATSAAFGYCLTVLHVPAKAANLIAERDIAGVGLYHGYGSDNPDCHADIAARSTVNRNQHRTIRHHGDSELRYRIINASGRFSAVHRLSNSQAANGESRQSNPAVLSLHVDYSAADNVCSSD